jgi:RluA family pseudouridine synthase
MDPGSPLTRRLTRRVGAADAGRRFDEWAQAWLGQVLGRSVSRSEVRRWIMAGALRMEGAPLRRPGIPVLPGRRLDATLRQEAERPPEPPPTLGSADILFEDAWLVAVCKPAGVPTHETADPRRPHLVGLLTRFLSARPAGDADRGEVRLGIHQRLDRDTSGVILFTKDRRVDAGLARQFADRAIVKTYHALVPRPARLPAREWSVRSAISPRPGLEQQAETDFRLLEVLPGGLLVEACPRTGRKHQIRVHLAEGGLPILGDERHGGSDAKTSKARRAMLHAFRLELRHPRTGLPLVIESPWPADFRQALGLLRAEAVARPPARGRRPRR